LHLLKEVLAEQQDTSGGGEDNGVLSGDITGGSHDCRRLSRRQ
jgi:hypothetical protein